MILCSYANFRSSYRRIEGISYLVGPGEWICKTSELARRFRTRFQHQALSILDFLQKQNYITYTWLGRNSPANGAYTSSFMKMIIPFSTWHS